MKSTLLTQCKKADPEYILLGSIALFLILSFAVLTFIEMDQHSHNEGWSLSFVDPDHVNTGFIITNHSQDPVFHYEILSEQTSIQSGDLSIPAKEKRIIPIEKMNDLNFNTLTIVVTNDDDQRNIFTTNAVN